MAKKKARKARKSGKGGKIKKKVKKVRKGKKAASRKSSGAPQRTTLARQLVAANQDLKTVYETEHRWRLDLLKANEDLSRETAAVEAEIRRLQQEGLQHRSRLTALDKQRGQLVSEAKGLARQISSLEGQCEKAGVERDGLEKNCKALSRQKDSLSKEAGRLGKDIARLKSDVARLAALRKQYLSQIAKFRTAKARLVEG